MYIRNILVFHDPNPIGYRIVDEIYGPRLMNRDEIIYIDDDELLQQENFNVRRPRGNPARRGIQNDVVPNRERVAANDIYDPNYIAAVIRQGPFIDINNGANNVLQGDAGDRGPDDGDQDIIQEAPIIDNNNNANVENQLNVEAGANNVPARLPSSKPLQPNEDLPTYNKF
ncbi:hypothetical protein HCN44_000307 [Aphidius gifuensis]|uniref:Uncharacterized protein n=1 Tax=Aphidius gifuensis TaxID=684658 RepID=A0A834XRT9_APHGI|nr:hypothetical protein HCN44_000307 [Aphidius gifuensis]